MMSLNYTSFGTLPSFNIKTPIAHQAMRTKNYTIKPPYRYNFNIKTNFDIEILKFVLVNLLKIELAKTIPNLLFNKTVINYEKGDTYQLDLNLSVDKLKLTFANERFLIVETPTKKLINESRLFYAFDLNDYLNVVTFSDNLLYGRKYFKTDLKISGFYILYTIGFKNVDDNILKNTYLFDLSIDLEIRLVFHNFAYLYSLEKLNSMFQFLIDNSINLFDGNSKIITYNTKVRIVKSDTSFANNVSNAISINITELQLKCFNKFIMRSFFDKNYNFVIKGSPGFDPLDNEYNRLKPIDVRKFIKSYK